MEKAIFFDRDGTLIIDKIYLNDPDGIEYLPDAVEALQRLRDANFMFFVVTNQSGVARGIVSIENLEEIHHRMRQFFAAHGIAFSGFYYAPYSVESNHFMRKPNPGMILTAAEEHGIDLQKSWIIGDRTSDVEAGRRAGLRTVLLNGVESEESRALCGADARVGDLLSAAQFILKNS